MISCNGRHRQCSTGESEIKTVSNDGWIRGHCNETHSVSGSVGSKADGGNGIHLLICGCQPCVLRDPAIAFVIAIDHDFVVVGNDEIANVDGLPTVQPLHCGRAGLRSREASLLKRYDGGSDSKDKKEKG